MTFEVVLRVSGEMESPMNGGNRQRGFTYLAVLFLVAAAGFGVATLAETWANARQREREAELLWIGNQFRQAIGLYYERSPGTVRRYPEALEDLLEDRRFLTKERYLRRIYIDPVTGKADWDVISAPGGGIMGVKSRSTARPIGRMSAARTYTSWEFVYEPAASRRTKP
jgi:type II secretory pathway pseudopilin PulG